MANNRMYIRCTGCKEAMMLAKHMATPWYFIESMPKALNVFFNKHARCGDGLGQYGMGGEHFDIVYENSCDDYRFISVTDLLKEDEE